MRMNWKTEGGGEVITERWVRKQSWPGNCVQAVLPGEGVGLLLEDGESPVQGQDGHVVLAWDISGTDHKVNVLLNAQGTVYNVYIF